MEASPGDSVATNKLPHKNWAAFPESPKKLYPSPSSGFCVTRIKQMNFFIRFKFFFVILLVFYFLLFNLTAPPGRQRQRQRKLFSSTLFFHSISGAINFCMFSLVVSAAFDDLCMFLMPSTALLPRCSTLPHRNSAIRS